MTGSLRSERRIRASAPARANLIGNPSDLYGGAVLGCSVPLRARVAIESCYGVELRTAGRVLAIRRARDLDRRGDLFDVGRAALRALDDVPGCRIAYESEIPLQSGLAGSTALLISILYGMLSWLGRDVGLYELAELSRAVEREILGVACGFVDHYLCAFGGLRYVDLRGKDFGLAADQQPFATVESLDDHVTRLPFLLAFTGVRHDSGQVHAPIRERFARGEPAVVAAYQRMAAIAREGKVAMLGEDWARLGQLMNENHALQRDLGGSGEANERLIEAALGVGAPGAKLAGAGHGGTIAVLWPSDDARPLEEALRRAGAAAFFRPMPVPGVRLDSA